MIAPLPYTHDSFRGVKHFARYMIEDDRLRLAPVRDAIWTQKNHVSVAAELVMTCILFRSGPWQIEMLAVHPGSHSRRHRHNFCESADILINGDLHGIVGDKPFKAPNGPSMRHNITTLPIGLWHGGGTNTGLVALSFQRWVGREPTFIANDWESYDGD